jgi:hypothetical protein
MKNKIPLSAISFFVLVFIACNTRQKSVWFQELGDTHQPGGAVLRIYLDKWGDFYPDRTTYIPYKYFFDPDSSGHTYRHFYTSAKRGSLKYFYSCNDVRWDTLRALYHSSLSRSQENFDSIQHIIQANYAMRINDSLAKDGSSLVVMIHGFNDPNPTGDYARMRNTINALYPGKKFTFLEVYWDGQTANQGSPAMAQIWGFAQASSLGVALSMRELLNRIDPGAKIRIITHSLGASVATGALFNVKSKWDDKSDYSARIDFVPSPPQKDIRICLFAPAIPGVNTFRDFNQRSGYVFNPNENNLKRIAIAYNPDDYAVTKKIRVLAPHVGATSLGADYKCEVRKTIKCIADSMKGADTTNLVRAFRFCESTGEKKEHAMYYYMQDAAQLNNALRYLFGE